MVTDFHSLMWWESVGLPWKISYLTAWSRSKKLYKRQNSSLILVLKVMKCHPMPSLPISDSNGPSYNKLVRMKSGALGVVWDLCGIVGSKHLQLFCDVSSDPSCFQHEGWLETSQTVSQRLGLGWGHCGAWCWVVLWYTIRGPYQ